MKFHKQEIEGVWLLETEPLIDECGIFQRNFCKRELEKVGIRTNIAQMNISENPRSFTFIKEFKF